MRWTPAAASDASATSKATGSLVSVVMCSSILRRRRGIGDLACQYCSASRPLRAV
jgi:hypothetical protein